MFIPILIFITNLIDERKQIFVSGQEEGGEVGLQVVASCCYEVQAHEDGGPVGFFDGEGQGDIQTDTFQGVQVDNVG